MEPWPSRLIKPQQAPTHGAAPTPDRTGILGPTPEQRKRIQHQTAKAQDGQKISGLKEIIAVNSGLTALGRWTA